MDASLFHTFKNICLKYYTHKNTVSLEISSKETEKAFLVKIKNKMSFQIKELM